MSPMRKQSKAAVLATAVAVAGCVANQQGTGVTEFRYDLVMRSTELAQLPEAERPAVASAIAGAPDRLIPALAAIISTGGTDDARLAVPSNASGVPNEEQMSLWHTCLQAKAAAEDARERPAPVRLPTLWD